MYGPEHDKAIRRWLKIRWLTEDIKKNSAIIRDLESKDDRTEEENHLLTSLKNKVERARNFLTTMS